MKSRRHNVSEDRQTIRRRRSRVNNVDEFSSTIPIDLIIDIFLRLPLKSIAKSRCVSKQWASVLGRPDFTEAFLTKSLARPQLLFAHRQQNEVIFFSSPQPQDPDEDSSPVAVANDHMTFHFDCVRYIVRPVCGLVCIEDDRIFKGRKTQEAVWVICNPSTGQSFTLPKMKTRKRTAMTSILGYDPIGKQHKVLAMTESHEITKEHQVLTLGGTGELTWRMVECGIPHVSRGIRFICINGVLYYTTSLDRSSKCYMIVCFHVRSEKFSVIKVMEPFTRAVHPAATVVNYNGKLASVMAQTDPYSISGTSTSFEMWVLQDPEKNEWSNHIYKLPPMWKDLVAVNIILYILGVTATNEIVLSSRYSTDAFHVYFYNFERETVRRVEIQGMGAIHNVYTFLNHVEDVKFMK